MEILNDPTKRNVVVVGSICALASISLICWKTTDYRMPLWWFKFASKQGYDSVPGRVESWRRSLIRDRWSKGAKEVDLVGRWRSEGCRDGDFICEFTEEGEFFIEPNEADSRTSVLWKHLNGRPYERFFDGYSVPAGRFGGDPFRKSGVVYGEAFVIHEPNGQVTTGWIAAERDWLEVTFDSIQYSIVYEKMLLKRPAEQGEPPRFNRVR